QADGDDILFIQNGIIVAHEVQSFDQNYDASNGRLIAWAKVNLSSTVDTTITMYYGNPLVGPQERPTEVWSDDYLGVWHLEETPTGALHEIDDSTSYENDGTAEGATLGYAGKTNAKVGSGLSFDEVDDLIRMNDSASLDSMAASGTFQLWILWDNAADGDWQSIMVSSNAFTGAPNDGYEWAVQDDGDYYYYPWRGDGSCYNLASNPFTNQQWHHLAVTMDYSTRTVSSYLDGNPISFVVVNCLAFWTQIASSDDILWGGHPLQANRYFDGVFDEIRASSTVRSEEWLSTEFANQNSPSTFYSVGSEVSRSQVSPSFKKTMTSAPAGLWTAIVRYNDSGSTVDHMVGAYERNFIIRHDAALTLQSPGDAASSGVSVRLAGEMLHVEVELTDEDAGSQPVAGATVTMNWTDTGSPTDVTLEDYGTGVYGIALNTSDLITAQSWSIDIQSSHQYYNPALASFDLELYHDTILKFQWLTTTPVGLDTTLTLVYTSAFDGTPIAGATISFANGTQITTDWEGSGMYNITLSSASLSMGDHLYTLEASNPTAFMIDANVTVTLTIRPHYTAVSASGDFIQPWGDTVDITILLIDMDTGLPLDIGFVQSFTFSWDATGDTENSPADYAYVLDTSSWPVGPPESVTLSIALSNSDYYLPDDYTFDVTIRAHYTAVSVSGVLIEPYGNNTELTVVITDLDTGAVFDLADIGNIASFAFTSIYAPQTINTPPSYDVLLTTSTWSVGITSVTLAITMSGSDYYSPSNYIFQVQIRTLQAYLYNEPSDLRFPNGDDFAIYLHVDVSEPNSQYYGDFINGLETYFTVTNASFTYPKTITPMGNGRYYLVIGTSYFPEGSYTITVTVDNPADNFAIATLVISFNYQPAESQLSSPNYPSVITAYQTDVTITLEFRDIDRDVGIDGASISSNISISINPLGSGQYEVTLLVAALAKGSHGFYITADASGYVQKTLDFTLTIRIAYTYAIPTVGALNIPVGDNPVFYVDYWDTDHDVSIDGATVIVS
ncbi:MAG: LamG-like jellyroll fold domain-containing protein, partial [Candidatus Thorarchaeota archaeon]